MTVTVNYGWDLPTIGGDTNTWGAALNANLVDLDTRLFGEISAARPINRGGTGAITAAAARTNLGATVVGSGLFTAVDVAAQRTALGVQPTLNPTFTGVPAAPTPVPATNTTQIATTAFVTAAIVAIPAFAPVLLTQAQVENPVSTVFGDVSGQRLNQETKSSLNAAGAAPMFACRAWVNFNGTGTVAIRGSGNVSSITDNGVGEYTINFATAMPNVNYAVLVNGDDPVMSGQANAEPIQGTRTVNSVRVRTSNSINAVNTDFSEIFVAIFA